jgi:hypothetical protein
MRQDKNKLTTPKTIDNTGCIRIVVSVVIVVGIKKLFDIFDNIAPQWIRTAFNSF